MAYDAAGREIGRNEEYSAYAPIHLMARPEKAEVRPGEVVYVPVTVEGANGVVESNADRKLSVTVEGGELLGFGFADPRTEERFDAGEYSTYYGRALAVVRAGAAGTMTVRAGDAAARIRIEG